MIRATVGGALAIALILAHPGKGLAQEQDPMVTDRPDFTESASTVGSGRFQFELGYTFTKAGDEERSDFGELLVRAGILSWLEGRLGLNSISLVRTPQGDQEGFQDLVVSFKALLYRKPEGSSAAVPQVALLFGVDLPTGDSGLGEDVVQPGAKLAFDFELTDRLNLGSNLGWAYLASGEERFHHGVGSIVLGYAISEPVTVYLEWYGLFPENRAGGANHYIDGGLTWGLTQNLQLDWRIGAGLQDPDPNWFTGVGLSFRL